jgi:MFS family permease
LEFVNRLIGKIQTFPRSLWLLAIASFLDVAGLSFVWPLNAVYIHDVLGKSLTTAGIVLLLNSAGASLGQLAGGACFDRFGARPVLLAGLFSSALWIVIPGFLDNWPIYVVVMILYGFSGSFVFPPMYALAGKSWPEGGRRAFNFLYVANNLGVAVGTAFGGMLAQHSFHLAFVSAAITFLVLTFIVWTTFRGDPFEWIQQTRKQGPIPKTAKEIRGEEHIPWKPILILYIGFFVLWLIYVQWQSAVSVHLQDEGITLSAYSLLWTLNGALIFCGQPLISWIVRKYPSDSSQMFLGIALYIASYLTIFLWNHYDAFVWGMVLLTLGEMLVWPTIPAAVSKLSPRNREGFLQGLIGSAATLGRMLGPLIGGMLFDYVGFRVLLIVMILLQSVPFLCIVAYRTLTLRVPFQDYKSVHS